MDNTIVLIISFFGGGVIGAAIQWARTARSEKEKRHSEYIHKQLNKLYGPLFFLTSQNQELLNLCNKILGAHKEHFDGNKWSDDPDTRKTLKEESLSSIQLSNEYVRQVVINNEKIVKLLQHNFAYIDDDDIEVVQEFIVDTIRMNKEVKEERLKEIPFEIYQSLGNISYSKPKFLNRIKHKFQKKQLVLKKYHS